MKHLPHQTSTQTPVTHINQSRGQRALRHRAEEQVVCAILHASSPYGFYALAASSVVWITQRNRSRFMASQSLQALLFQLSASIALILLFGLFMAGFFFTAFSGLIAQTGVDEPVLTTILIAVWIFGMVSIFFVAWVFPLWGVWAAIQILRGRNYRYPILGEYAIKWGPSRENAARLNIEEKNAGNSISESEKILAVIGHLSIVVGFGPVVGPILWAANKQRSQFLSCQLLQAPLFQLMMTGIIVVTFIGLWE